MTWRVGFNQPTLEGLELDHIREAVESSYTAAGGHFSERVARLLSQAHGAEDVLLTTSCTDALEMSAMLLDIQPGDVVIVPSFTFVSTALAFVRQGARLLFADIEPDTLALDPAWVAELMEPAVKAVVTVHYAGIAGDVATLTDVLAQHPSTALVEDNAHGLYGSYRGRPLGSFGRFSTLSFHETKNFVCGEGGALVVNDRRDVERAHTLLDKGTNRRAFNLGHVDKYTWVDIGSSFGMSDILAAYLLGQLEAKDVILKKRAAIFARYEELLAPYAAELGYRLPGVPSDRAAAYHMFYVLLPDRRTRDRVLTSMNAAGIQAVFHYVPLHDSPAGEVYRLRPTSCPVTADIAGRLLRLPFHNSLTDHDVELVATEFLASVGA